MVKYQTFRIREKSKMKIQVKKNEGIQLIPIGEVFYIEADTPYTQLHLANGQKIFSVDPIRSFDERLQDHGFLRIHKSTLVNIAAVEVYHKEGNGSVTLQDGRQLKLARGKKKKLIEMFGERFL